MITGDLTDFSLRDILGFLASASSSGVLELTTITQHAGVVLHEGGICVALREVDSVRGLVARMLHAGAVDPDEVRALAADGAADAIDLAGALARRTARRKSTAGVFREHTCETLTWLTRHDGMRFSFAASDRPGSWPLSTLGPDELYDEVKTCADGWDELSEIAGDLTRVCSPVPQAPAGDGITLTGEQWRVLSLVDGHRTLADLIELCGIGYLETCRQLRQLVDDGLVEVIAPGASSKVQELLAVYDIAPPVAAAAGDGPLPLSRLVGDGHPEADPRTTQPLELSIVGNGGGADAPDAEPSNAIEAAGDGELPDEVEPANDAEPVHADLDDDDATDDANRQLLRRLMSRRSAGA